MTTNISTQESKILDILQHLESINLSLSEVVEYKNNLSNKKKYIFNVSTKHSWASDDEDSDNEEVIDVIEEKECDNTEKFINGFLLLDLEVKKTILSSWNDIKIRIETDNKELITELPYIVNKPVWGNHNFITKKPTFNKKIINDRINIYTLDDFRNCISAEKKIKGCIHGWGCSNKFCKRFYHIHPDAHCFHTYKGTLCENVLNCNHIHIQRCLNEIEHYVNGNIIDATECPNKKKSCSFLHKSDLLDDTCKENFDNSINDYKKKKPKQFFNQ
jgi:hypothetical protein